MKRVVITGLGMVSPIGNSVSESWDGIKNYKCGIDKITAFNSENVKAKLAGEVKNLNFDEYMDKKEQKACDRFTLFAKIAAREAVLDSKLDMENENHEKVGVILGSGIGGINTILDMHKTLLDRGANRVSPFFIPRSIINLASGQLSIEYNAQGISIGEVSACASGTNAIGEAFNRILLGYEDVIICGGAEAAINELCIAGFDNIKALYDGDDITRASIPFDAERKGFVLGEGAGILIIEELEHALKRNAKIYAEVVGYGVTCDAYHITAPLLDGTIASRAMTQAMEQAKMDYHDMTYINAHGTSTHLNDLTETNAVKLAFKDHAYDLYMSSTKSYTGHLLGGAGAIEAIFSIMAIKDSYIPATINYKVSDPECDLNVVANKGINKEVKYAMSNSLGFGGHNASLIFKRYGDE